jgi:GTPase SAR1 family protein
VEINDTAGQEEFTTLWDDWIKEGDAIILVKFISIFFTQLTIYLGPQVYSVDSPRSFEVITRLHPLIMKTREDDFATIPMSVA